MIINRELLSMAESQEFIDKKKESQANVLTFIKKFTDLSSKDAKELRKKLNDLKIEKLREENIIKIIDLLPDNQDDLNKIATGLDEDESKRIFDEIKKFK